MKYVEERQQTLAMARTRYGYDKVGNLVSVDDDRSNVFRMFYDSRGLKRRMEDPDMSNCATNPADCPWRYEYDLGGRLTAQTDAKNQRIEFNVDELGRVYDKHYACTACGETDVTFSFDGAVNAKGRLVSSTKGAESDTFTYDNWGRATSTTKVIAGVSKATDTSFDWQARPTLVFYPSGEIAEYAYQAGGQVGSVLFEGVAVLSSASYDALGRPTSVTWGNGLTTTTTTGPNEKASRIAVGTVLDFQYAYDPNGNTQSIQEVVEGWTRTHRYDWGDRLISASQTGVYPNSWAWTYDTVGNMLHNSDWESPSGSGGAADGDYKYVTAGPHAVTEIGASGDGSPSYKLNYDGNGYLVSTNTGASYGHNFDGRATSYEDTSASPNPMVRFFYDGQGNRNRKTFVPSCGTEKEVRYYGPHYEEEWSGGVLQYQVRYVMLGGTRLAFKSPENADQLRYLHPDVQGTIGLVTDPAGAVVQRRLFAPYGNPMAETGSALSLRYGYTGQEYDAESGQMHLGVRQYDVAIGRFPQPDSIVPDPMRPQTLNRYAYAYNNPVRYTDPSGYAPPEASGKSQYEQAQAEAWKKGAKAFFDFKKNELAQGLSKFAEVMAEEGPVKMVFKAYTANTEKNMAQAVNAEKASGGGEVAQAGAAVETLVDQYGAGYLNLVSLAAIPGSFAGTKIATATEAGWSGGTTRFLHGSTAAGEKSILAEGIQAVSVNTGIHPQGSFFAFEASQASALRAASHWPVVSGKASSSGVGVVEMCVKNDVLYGLQSQGLMRQGGVAGAPGMPAETIFYPGAFKTLNESAVFRSVAPDF